MTAAGIRTCGPGECERASPCQGRCLLKEEMIRRRRAFNRGVIRRVRDAGVAPSLKEARAFILAHGGYEVVHDYLKDKEVK